LARLVERHQMGREDALDFLRCHELLPIEIDVEATTMAVRPA
jgi:hypothetical protein